jgi:DNA-binding LacI/PurR family transcriptional regulator
VRPTHSSARPDVLHRIRVDPDAPLPMSAQVSQQLVWLIASGEVKVGDRLPPVRALAERLGINQHTVRAAYAALQAEGLVSMRQGRGTTVLAHDAQSLARVTPSTQTHTIGILIPGLNPFYLPFLEGIDEAARSAPWLFFVSYTRDSPVLPGRYVAQLIAKGVDGLILAAGGLEPQDWNSHSGSGNRSLPPVVCVDMPTAPGHVVLLDSEGAAFRATEHLIAHGRRRIGMISGPVEADNLQPCYQGYKRALAAAGLAIDARLVAEVPHFHIEMGRQATERLLNLSRPPTAIFGAADVLAIGAMQAVKERGLRVPEDIAVAGYNDIGLAALVDPSLTTARAPAYEMGVTAMNTLQRLIAGESVEPQRVTLDTPLVIRCSCGCGKNAG